ncbi:PASTA domain-containing protein [Streptomyces sp. BPTC-684]|uniref:PASTA domain-containing protein n=1 Tax=Streptomyces sp. BPTC-684 TaxID=3043734 RepID=UPI0024B0C725|nr:PASTA domain-containing protein [Streptomyces sp. BPTC-684]WHM40791.1 PASTA domain-containing protein [Streptomyces sp. BPTC-684]
MRVRNKIFGGLLAGALATVLNVAGAGAGNAAQPASAPVTPVGAGAHTASVPTRAAVAAATPLVFDVNGTFTDGGSARPVISDVNDILTVDMSSQHRPTATGVVINSDTILVTFPDDATYTAKLQAPNTIRWSNGSTWQKLNLVRVPDVRDETQTVAKSILNSAGFAVGTVTTVVDRTCNHNKTVSDQTPGAGTSAVPGTAVDLTIGLLPPKGQCQ